MGSNTAADVNKRWSNANQAQDTWLHPRTSQPSEAQEGYRNVQVPTEETGSAPSQSHSREPDALLHVSQLPNQVVARASGIFTCHNDIAVYSRSTAQKEKNPSRERWRFLALQNFVKVPRPVSSHLQLMRAFQVLILFKEGILSLIPVMHVMPAPVHSIHLQCSKGGVDLHLKMPVSLTRFLVLHRVGISRGVKARKKGFQVQ